MDQSELLAVIQQAGQDESPELDLANQGIDHLPPEIGNLSQLSELNLVDNSLTTIPVEIGNLHNLTGLHLSQQVSRRATSGGLQPDILEGTVLAGT